MVCANVKFTTTKDTAKAAPKNQTDSSENKIPAGLSFKIIFLLAYPINLLIIGYSLQILLCSYLLH
jgi:hypothetical protein